MKPARSCRKDLMAAAVLATTILLGAPQINLAAAGDIESLISPTPHFRTRLTNASTVPHVLSTWKLTARGKRICKALLSEER